MFLAAAGGCIQQGVDYFVQGNTAKIFRTIDSAETCQSLCQESSVCQVFSFRVSDDVASGQDEEEGPTNGTCYLGATIEKRQRDRPKSTSGPKYCN